MTARMLSGTEPAEALLATLREKVAMLNPLLVIVQAGDDAASASYIRKKLAACESIGMRHAHHHFPEQVSAEELQQEVASLNADPDVTGYIIQLPLPSQLEAETPLLFRSIDPKKDIDGFTAYNIGKMFLSREFEHLPPATPAGVLALLEHYDISIPGKHAVIVGHSNIVGKPLAVMLMNRNATVTICNEQTPDLRSLTLQADILISAAGVPGLIGGSMIKPGAVVVDIGTTYTKDGLLGDVQLEEALAVASAITPVPGGVGPMTVASLLNNCVRAKERQTIA